MGNKYVEERIPNVALYYVTWPMATVRSTAKAFGISKSTAHKDLTDRLSTLYGHDELKKEVQKKIEMNTKERARRGGEATRKKYLSMKKL